ncbi:MAG TPA: lipocalin family protein [Caulobacteraceae bacterium]|nr:lipocalin family protein [Caulobacteraceae bacterium]
MWRELTTVTGAGVAAVALIATSAPAAWADPTDPPNPQKPVDMQRLAGRWYEVARVPNLAESDCPFATTDWDPQPNGKFKVTQVCSKSASGPPGRTIHATADPLDPSSNTKWRMNYFGGLIRRDYWVLDYAPDDSWVILGMPGPKHYVWILARQPVQPQAQREQVVQKIAALGYDASRLVFPVMLASRGG